jgi:F-type H+-transporting ATPase subunit epsilon
VADANTPASGRMLQVSVVTPEGAAYEGTATHVVAPAFDGEVAFYPQHAPYVGVLGYGELRVSRPDGKTEFFYLAGGVVQVASDVVTILAERVTPTGKLTIADAEEELSAVLEMTAVGDEAIEDRLVAMEDARSRLRTAQRAKARGALSATETVNQPVE